MLLWRKNQAVIVNVYFHFSLFFVFFSVKLNLTTFLQHFFNDYFIWPIWFCNFSLKPCNIFKCLRRTVVFSNMFNLFLRNRFPFVSWSLWLWKKLWLNPGFYGWNLIEGTLDIDWYFEWCLRKINSYYRLFGLGEVKENVIRIWSL